MKWLAININVNVSTDMNLARQVSLFDIVFILKKTNQLIAFEQVIVCLKRDV